MLRTDWIRQSTQECWRVRRDHRSIQMRLPHPFVLRCTDQPPQSHPSIRHRLHPPLLRRTGRISHSPDGGPWLSSWQTRIVRNNRRDIQMRFLHDLLQPYNPQLPQLHPNIHHRLRPPLRRQNFRSARIPDWIQLSSWRK